MRFQKGHKGYWKGKHHTSKQKENSKNAMIKWHKENRDNEKYKKRCENIGKALIGKKRPDMIGNKFCMGKPAWNKGLHIRMNPKGEFKKGQIPWNKGLTKEDPRVRKNCEKLHKTMKEKNLYGHNKGKKSILQSKSKLGVKNPAWQGGITPLHKKIRYSEKYKIWIKKVFERDKFICQDCKKRERQLEAHHKKEFAKILKENNIKTFEQAMNCQELWNINNGMTLCKKCHAKVMRKVKI